MSADGLRLVDLGSDVLAQITNSLTHKEWARLAQVCRAFHSAVEEARARCTHANVDTLQLTSPFILSYTIGHFVLRSTLNLRSLILRGTAIDDSQLDSLTHLKQLQTLDIASTDVTSLGLRCLWSLQSLNELDLTFCPYVSYSSVLELRQHCPNLKMIRRQPKWLDGVFVTPWDEIHTYYPCGAFSFTREVNSEGWVAQLRNHGEYLENRLIFVDEHITDMRWRGRVGVLLKKMDIDPGKSTAEEDRVLVLQSRVHPEPPRAFPSDFFEVPPPGQTIDLLGGTIMVSTMKVGPFEAGCTEPPAELQTRLRQFCDARMPALPGSPDPGGLIRRESEATSLLSILENATDHFVIRRGPALVSALVADPLMEQEALGII